MADDEIFDVCDLDDRVIGQATRKDVHARGLFHRAVHIWVWNSAGQLLVHRRSDNKDEYPGCWTSSASGHVDHGETYEQAAHRELQEELGLHGILSYQLKLPASTATAREHTVLYFLKSDETPRPDPGEIQEVRFLSRSQVAQLVHDKQNCSSPPFFALLEATQIISGP